MELEQPNQKSGFMCAIHKPFSCGWHLTDFHRKKVVVNSLDDLYELYLVSAQQHVEHTLKKIPGMKRFGKDNYLDWLVKMKICPQSIITRQSKYWLETVNYCDGEMGLSLPGPMNELPNIFFEALKLIRSERSSVRKEEDKPSGKSQNSNKNKG